MQLPLPSQITPPFWLQGVPTGAFWKPGTPKLHRSNVQSLPSFGTSVLSTVKKMPPMPSHAAAMQSPAICELTVVPAAVRLSPHMPPAHVRDWHSVSWPGQSLLVWHCPQLALTHRPTWQSALAWHDFPEAQGGHAPPPQSTSVSWPSFMPLKQEENTTQAPAWHTALGPHWTLHAPQLTVSL